MERLGQWRCHTKSCTCHQWRYDEQKLLVPVYCDQQVLQHIIQFQFLRWRYAYHWELLHRLQQFRRTNIGLLATSLTANQLGLLQTFVVPALCLPQSRKSWHYRTVTAATTITVRVQGNGIEEFRSFFVYNAFRFYARRFSIERNSYGNVSGWVAGWLSVTLRYCIKTAKPIRKLFRPSESPMTLLSWDPCDDTKFHGEPLHRGR